MEQEQTIEIEADERPECQQVPGVLFLQAERTGVREAQLILGLMEAGEYGRPLELIHLAAILNLEQTGKLGPEQNEGWDLLNAVCGDAGN